MIFILANRKPDVFKQIIEVCNHLLLLKKICRAIYVVILNLQSHFIFKVSVIYIYRLGFIFRAIVIALIYVTLPGYTYICRCDKEGVLAYSSGGIIGRSHLLCIYVGN